MLGYYSSFRAQRRIPCRCGKVCLLIISYGYKFSPFSVPREIFQQAHGVRRVFQPIPPKLFLTKPLDKIAEEYPEINLTVLYFTTTNSYINPIKANFPPIKPANLRIQLPHRKNNMIEFTKEVALKLLNESLFDSNLIKRLFGDKVSGINPFPEAAYILWNLEIKYRLNFKMLNIG